ncbi:MAG TPA: 50S ribosomal protein L25 [Phycisphaerales bacterium]|nr:50S ribosomal protein L25 [Phycisphaerales bacterium]
MLLKAEIREDVGSKSAAKVRKQGRVPAVVYGHKKKPVAVSLDAHNLVEGLHHGGRVVDVQIGKKKETMIFKDLQYDYLGKDIIHVDLMRVDATEMIKVAVPIELKGTAKGTHEGGIIEEHTNRLEIECKVTDIPEAIVVSVKEIGVGDTLHAGDIKLGEGVKLVSSPSTLLLTCSLVAAAKSTEELEEEASAAPEIIGETKETEEESSKQEA